MSQKTAVTENISYEIEECQFCGQDVALGDVPDNILEETGYMVLVGEGSVSHTTEDEGNWDEEFRFELDEDANNHPNVEGYILCEDCSQEIHDFDRDTEPFTGNIPELLNPPENGISEAELKRVLLIGIILIMFFLFCYWFYTVLDIVHKIIFLFF